EAGKRYKAIITITGETAVTADLPAAKAMGYTFGINNSEKDSIYVKVATNEKTLAADKGQFFYILAQSNGRVYYTASGRLEGTTYTASIARSRLPEGIAQFTLFSQTGEPLAERIVFIENKADEIDVTLSTNRESYKTHGKVTLNLIAKDSANKPVTGSFSVAVINESKVNPDESNEYTILNKLLLSSELKGYIEQPNYYFTNQSDKTRANLDLLMLTQGYRRYDWKQILTNPTNTTYLPERTQELAGTITTPSGKPLPNSKITLAVTRQNIFRDTIAGENGRFVFTGLNITDTAVVVIRASKGNKGNNVKIIPERQDYPKIAPANYPTEVATADTTRLAIKYSDFQKEQKDYMFKNGRMLKTVTIKGYRRPSPPKIPNSSNLHGGGNADQVIMYDQMGDGPDLASRLMGKINFVTFSQGGTPLNTRTLSKMAIIVDGITLSGDHLGDINPDDVYSIEVLRTSFAKNIYGSSLPGDGALIITTKRGVTPVDPASIHPAGLIAINYAGLYKAKAFYTPKYSALPKHNGPPDKRTTTYWNPNILTDKDGKATIDFYNNDNDGKYRVVVEGIDDNGSLGRQVYRYIVNSQ
ncbi:MAG: TonB-dependent receptor, partial [Bacteroidetes bacterium]|nr:TonB-dependent receptor [Bacteroidota bacterium]